MKVDEKTRKQIIQLLEIGYPRKKISEITGISYSTIGRIKQQMGKAEDDPPVHKQFPKDLLPEWKALNEIGRKYRAEKEKKND